MNPNNKIQLIQHTIRKMGLLPLVEKLRTFSTIIKYHFKNKKFLLENPNFSIPPQALAYDAYSAPDWNFYKKSGEETAVFLRDISIKYLQDLPSIKILEWGCGPGRVVRHIPLFFPSNANTYASDYNEATVKWCKQNILNVEFLLNDLRPPLKLGSNFFDFIYSISVFTHLSEENSHQWIAELYRIAKPGGILVISTNGDSRQKFMLNHELKAYLENGILIRGNVEEGKKMFWACHSPNYLKEKLFKKFEVLDFVGAGFPHTGQDCWILRKLAQ
jgi:SAM-dependent methyltransferase